MDAFVALRQLVSSSVEITQLALENAEIIAKLKILELNDELLKREGQETLEAVNDLSEYARGEIDNLYAAFAALSAKTPKLEKSRQPIGYPTTHNT